MLPHDASKHLAAPLTPVGPLAGSLAGTRIGRYELIGLIARGGMGSVYLCRHASEAGFQRLFALKLMHEHLIEEQEFVHMFLDEARIAARIHHHNVVSILDLGSSPRGHYVVMEYVEGASLSELLRRSPEPRPLAALIPIFIDFLTGLQAAHSLEDDDGHPMHLVHRDVSPANVLVGSDGVARIADFGVAKATARITSTRPGVHKGKLAFTAPEQLERHSAELADARVDVWAAGAVMWTALSGARLFQGDSDVETIRNVLHTRVPPPSAVGLRPASILDDIVMKALNRDPAGRFATAGEMAEAIRRAAANNGLLMGPTAVTAWLRAKYGKELKARRQAIRSVQENTDVDIVVTESGSISGEISAVEEPSEVIPPPPPRMRQERHESPELLVADLQAMARAASPAMLIPGPGSSRPVRQPSRRDFTEPRPLRGPNPAPVPTHIEPEASFAVPRLRPRPHWPLFLLFLVAVVAAALAFIPEDFLDRNEPPARPTAPRRPPPQVILDVPAPPPVEPPPKAEARPRREVVIPEAEEETLSGEPLLDMMRNAPVPDADASPTPPTGLAPIPGTPSE